MSAPGRYRLVPRQALHLGRRAGQLRVIDGAVWLTRRGDPDDHILQPGERLWLPPGHGAVVEPHPACRGARLDWRPQTPWWRAVLLASLFLGAARLGGVRRGYGP